MANINCRDYSAVVRKLRSFFESKGFLEAHTQHRLSILAACEDPGTISTYNYEGSVWPLPQTGQMWLEYELLKNPTVPGYFCVSTSYRNEPNPVPNRHERIFPMFEFELKGGMDKMVELESELLDYLGFTRTNSGEYAGANYDDVAREYGVNELENEHETRLNEDHGPVFFLKNFPLRTSPFWNMRLHSNGTHANKVDVILHGMETIGSAERSCSPEEMRHMFYTISDGEYANTLFGKFDRSRVVGELDDFLSLDFFPRSGGGIGMTRLIRAMKLSNLI